jgi:hypothetical protein
MEKNLVGKPEMTMETVRARHRWDDNIKMNRGEAVCEHFNKYHSTGSSSRNFSY